MTTAAPARVCECLTIPRVVDGQPTTEEIVIDFDPETGRLIIDCDWSERHHDHRHRRIYKLAVFGTDFGDFGVRLTKDEDTRYDLLVDGGRVECDCKGHVAYGRCVHAATVKWLSDNGLFGERT